MARDSVIVKSDLVSSLVVGGRQTYNFDMTPFNGSRDWTHVVVVPLRNAPAAGPEYAHTQYITTLAAFRVKVPQPKRKGDMCRTIPKTHKIEVGSYPSRQRPRRFTMNLPN